MLVGCSSSTADTPVGAPPPPEALVYPAGEPGGAAAVNDSIAGFANAGDSLAGKADASYQIGPEDRVDVRVFQADALSGVFQVNGDGTISVPLLGPVKAAGYTSSGLEESLEARLKQKYMKDPHVTVQITEMHSHAVSVLGAVNKPGVYQIAGDKTLLEVLAMAEGVKDGAEDVLVMRRGDTAEGAASAGNVGDVRPASTSLDQGAADDATEVAHVNLGALVRSGDAAQNLVVQPGDIIAVRPGSLVYVVGQVNRPGGFAMSTGTPMTVLQAVALAQGLGNRAAASSSYIVRKGKDGSRQEIPVNLDDMLSGSTPPATLQPQDVLFVPQNRAKTIALGAVDALVRMVTLRGLIY
jgi:polysaccharide biosynthesis/export protein